MRISALFLTLFLTATLMAQQTDDVIIPISGAPDILVPAAGDVTGVNGTHFRSDISIINLRNVTQRVQLYWLPQGANGQAIAPVSIDLSALSGFQSDDFVGSVLNRAGLGSIEVLGVSQAGIPDPEARLHVAARIWTPRPDGAPGTMSQTFPAIALVTDQAKLKSIFGLRRTAQYRLNVGISNPTPQARRFRVTTLIVPSSGSPVQSQLDVEVAAASMEQRAILGSIEGIAQVLVEDITSPAVTGTWHTWASVVDNFSGDAWSQMGVPGS
jgi:hypothetical protein